MLSAEAAAYDKEDGEGMGGGSRGVAGVECRSLQRLPRIKMMVWGEQAYICCLIG